MFNNRNIHSNLDILNSNSLMDRIWVNHTDNLLTINLIISPTVNHMGNPMVNNHLICNMGNNPRLANPTRTPTTHNTHNLPNNTPNQSSQLSHPQPQPQIMAHRSHYKQNLKLNLNNIVVTWSVQPIAQQPM